MRKVAGSLAAMLSLGLALGCDRSEQRSSDGALVVNVSSQPATVDLPLPAFALIDQHGKPFTSESMKGKTWIVDFVFTSCPSICPALTRKMALLVDRLADEPDVGFLSISVDPENDTPELMRAFLERNGKDSPRWAFVTGAPDVVQSTVIQGFKIRLDRDRAGTLSHGEHFVLVGKELRIRGYFDVTGEGSLDPLVARAKELAHE